MKVQMWYCCKISLRAMKMTFKPPNHKACFLDQNFPSKIIVMTIFFFILFFFSFFFVCVFFKHFPLL
jgi:hypothetical protein